MTSILIILGILSAVALSGFFSGIETAIYCVNTVDLQIYSAKGCKKNQRVLKILGNKPKLITTMLIGTNLAIFVATSLLTNFLDYLAIGNTEVLTTLILTPFCFLFAESLPKRIAFGIANKALVQSTSLIIFFEILFFPLSYLLGGLGGIIRYCLGKMGLHDTGIAGRMRLFENFEAKVAEGGLSNEQYKLASKIMNMDSLVISNYTLKSLDTFTVDMSMTCEDAAKAILASGFSRALLVDSKGEFTGEIITVNSIIACQDKGTLAVGELAEKAYLLNEHVSFLHAISRMRKKGVRVAIVIDKNKRYLGAVHLNTLLNSIIGFKKD